MLFIYLSMIDSPEDRNRFGEIYLDYRNHMFNLANSILKNDANAEDIVHDVFCKIAEKHLDFLLSLDSPKRIRYYLLIATKNTAYNYIRDSHTGDISLEDYQESADSASASDDNFVQTIYNNMMYQNILNAIESLNSIYRDPLYYHLILEMSVPHTAHILGKNISTVEKQLVRGKKTLISLLEQPANKKSRLN